MSRWAERIKEFHQLVTPDGDVYDLVAASQHGRWVLSSAGWGMPGIEWLTQSSPFQHGATVYDYRLQPRVLQLLVRQSYCNRDEYWAGRQALINALRPNRTPISFTDYWTPRSQYQGGGSYPLGDDQTSIKDLAIFNDQLYGCTGEDGSDTGGLLLLWDGAGSWVNVAPQPFVTTPGGTVYTSECINCLCPVTMDVPVFSEVLSGRTLQNSHDSGDDTDLPLINPAYWRSQAFIPTADFVLSDIQVRLWQTSLDGNVWCYIYEGDGAGEPVGSPLATASMDAFYVTTDVAGTWVDFGSYSGTSTVWSATDVALTAGQQYVIVIWADGADTVAGKLLTWRVQNVAPPAGEETMYSANSGTLWAAQGDHAMFRVYGAVYTESKTGEESRQMLLAGTSAPYGMVVPWDGEWLDTMGADQELLVQAIYDIIQWTDNDDTVYAVGYKCQLLEYTIDIDTGVGDFDAAATPAGGWGAFPDGLCLEQFDDGALGSLIYVGTSDGRLFRWSGVMGAAYTEVAAAPGAETHIWDLLVHNGQLFGCTGPNGYLVRYDVAGAHWDVVSQSLGHDIRTLRVYKGRIYGAGEDGHLYRWNDVNAWEVVLHEWTGEGVSYEQILCSAEYNGRFFVGTETGAYLLEWMHERLYDRPLCTVLRRLLSTGEKRDLCVYLAEGPKFDPAESGWDEFGFTEMLRLIAYEPIMYDPTVVSVPYLFGTGYVSDYEDIVYSGTWETHPTLILTGPLNDPRVINEGIDAYIALDYHIADGEVVTIDPDAGTVENEDGTNLIGAVTPDSALATFRLVPSPEVAGGSNRVRLVAGGATANSDFELQYYRRYIGI